jgi:hypothetical protein
MHHALDQDRKTKKTMKKFWIKKGVMISVFFIAAVLFFSAVVMALWNAVLPAVIAVQPISYVQAIGLLILSKILFGGFGGRKGSQHKAKWVAMKEKFSGMTPEEKEKFKAEWKNRCGSWGMRSTKDTSSGMAAE